MANKLVFIADIDFDSSPKVRVALHQEVAAEYAEAYKAKTKFPLPQLFKDANSKFFLIADGRHRIEGQRIIGKKAIECEVHKGDYEAALRFGLACNIHHGLRRTNADKRECVEAAIRQWPGLSSSELADVCFVSRTYVSEIRREDMEQLAKDTDKEAEDTRNVPDPNESQEENKKDSSSEKKKSEKKEEEKKPEPPKDEMGFPLTPLALEYFSRAQEVQDLMTKSSQIRSLLKNAQEGKDLLFGNLYSQLVTPLDLVYGLLSSAKPYATCLFCNGTLKDSQKRKVMGDTLFDPKGQHCQYCHGIGVMSKFAFDQNCKTFPDLKKGREKAINELA